MQWLVRCDAETDKRKKKEREKKEANARRFVSLPKNHSSRLDDGVTICRFCPKTKTKKKKKRRGRRRGRRKKKQKAKLPLVKHRSHRSTIGRSAYQPTISPQRSTDNAANGSSAGQLPHLSTRFSVYRNGFSSYLRIVYLSRNPSSWNVRFLS